MFDTNEPQSPQNQSTQNPFPDDSTEDISIQISSSPISSCVHDFQKINWPATEVIRDSCRCGQSDCQCARSKGLFHCPACQSDVPSLSLSEVAGQNGNGGPQTLWHCRRGCAQAEVTRAIYECLFSGAAALFKSAIVAPQPIVASQLKKATDAIGASRPAAGYANRSSVPHSNGHSNHRSKRPSKEPPFTKDLATCAFKTLRQRGVSPQTQRDFDIENHVGAALIYPAPFPDGGEPALRGKGLRPDLTKYFWHSGGKIALDGVGNEVEVFPSLYNHQILTDASKRNGRAVHLVKSEAEVWTMHDANMLALSFLNETLDPAPLLAQLQAWHINTIHVIFNNDVVGRKNALLVLQAGEAAGIHVKVRLLRGPLGFDLSDLYESVGFNSARLRDAITELEYVSKGMLGQWRQDIEFDLPAPYDANSMSGDSSDSEDDGEDENKNDEEIGFACMDEAGIATLPAPEFAVQGFVIARQVTLLVGQYYTGKSFVALDMCLSISAGVEWNGCRTKTGHTLYVAAEGRDGLAKRIAAWKKHHGIERVPHFRALGHAVPLTDDGQCRRLINTLHRHSRELGVPAALVVLDTLSKNIGGTEENSASDMSAFLNAAQTICDETGAAVLILHHPNHQGVVRGSTALPANSDGYLMLEGKSGSEVVRLRTPKVRDFGTSEMVLRKIIIALDEMPDEYGAPSTSVVFACDTKPNPANLGRVISDESDESWDPEHSSGAATRKAARRPAHHSAPEPHSHKKNSGREQDWGRGRSDNDPSLDSEANGKTGSDYSLSDKERAVLRVLSSLCQNNGDSNDNSGNRGGATFREWETAAMDEGVSKATFARARKRLGELGLVACSEPGKVGGLFTPIAST